jgi:hypothetical protein
MAAQTIAKASRFARQIFKPGAFPCPLRRQSRHLHPTERRVAHRSAREALGQTAKPGS